MDEAYLLNRQGGFQWPTLGYI